MIQPIISAMATNPHAQTEKMNEMIEAINRCEVMIKKMQRRYALMTGLSGAPQHSEEDVTTHRLTALEPGKG